MCVGVAVYLLAQVTVNVGVVLQSALRRSADNVACIALAHKPAAAGLM